jgi:hypothetical protein
MSMLRWSKELSSKIKEVKPISKSAAELIAEHQDIAVQDL